MAVATTLTVVLVTYFSFPVTGIKVEGALMYPESEAWDAVPDHASLLTLNKEELKRKVQSNPWVQGVKVYENWKSGIVTVQVEERHAVLDAEVDGRRIILSNDGRELPGLGGAGLDRVELDRDQVGEILEFARVLNASGVRLDSVEGAGAGGIEATVDGRTVIFSGDVDESQARALKDIMPRHPDAQLFDLRSPERVVVGAPAPDETNSGSRG
ncbi:MAG TPA: FtsQ-type POTRA domain-containing protein [Rubrobacter sp.]|nr:FtsQ-type POTRA domain-containing protein [Rubrobacter sp.]